MKLRSIESLIQRPQLDRLWSDSSEEEQAKLREYILKADKDSVISWIKNHPSLELAEKPLVDLKKIAYKLGITNYSRKGKLQLVRDIQEKEKQYGSQQSIVT